MADLRDRILSEAVTRQHFWRERDEAQDAQTMVALLYDEAQRRKLPGFKSFETNWPATVIDRGTEMLSRNPANFRIPLEDSLRGDRDLKSRIERWCRGLWNDVDTRLAKTGWTAGSDRIVGQHLLEKGMAASEIVLSEREQERRGSPVKYHWWDPRHTYPYWDDDGLNSVLYCLEVPLAEVSAQYPKARIEGDQSMTVTKYVWYDRDYYGCMASYVPKRGGDRRNEWLIRPYKHELDEIPVVIVGANQRASHSVPGMAFDVPDEDFTGITKFGRPPRTPQGLWGRGILWNVGRQIPQFNEFMAMMMQIIASGAYGTWVLRTPDGGMRPLDIGAGVVNPLQLTDQLQRIDAPAPPQGLGEAMTALFREIQTGTMPAELMAAISQATSGFHEAQLIAIAMNSIGNFMDAHNKWKEMVTQEALRQFANSDFTMLARGFDGRRTPFELPIQGGEIERYYDIRVQRKPALPDDMMARIQMSKQALDPAMPVLDPWTVLDEIMEVEDPDGVMDKNWEWKAMSFPPIMFKVMRKALLKRGVPEDEIREILDQETLLEMQKELQRLQGQGTIAQMRAQLQPTGMSPSTMPPEMANPGMELAPGGAAGPPPGMMP